MNQFTYEYKGTHLELTRLMKVLSFQREFCDYLTLKTVCFVENKEKASSKENMCDWWKRIHTCKIDYTNPSILEVYRSYDRKSDMKRSVRRLKSCIAQFNILNKNSTEHRSFDEDCRDMLSYLNDNDFYGFAPDSSGVCPIMRDEEYDHIQIRKARQYRGIIKEKPNCEVKNEKEQDQT